MMNSPCLINFHRENYSFHDWANRLIFGSIQQLVDKNSGELLPEIVKNNSEGNQIFVRILRLFHHTINATEIWLCRIKGEQVLVTPWETFSFFELEDRMKNISDVTNNFISELKDEDLIKIIFYTNLQGQQYQNSIHEILTHIVNHGVYHRAQIAALMRQMDITPPSTDMIVYYRNKRNNWV